MSEKMTIENIISNMRITARKGPEYMYTLGHGMCETVVEHIESLQKALEELAEINYSIGTVHIITLIDRIRAERDRLRAIVDDDVIEMLETGAAFVASSGHESTAAAMYAKAEQLRGIETPAVVFPATAPLTTVIATAGMFRISAIRAANTFFDTHPGYQWIKVSVRTEQGPEHAHYYFRQTDDGRAELLTNFVEVP